MAFCVEVGETLPRQCRPYCLLDGDATPIRVIERAAPLRPHAKCLRTSLSHTDEDSLRELLEKSRQQARPCAWFGLGRLLLGPRPVCSRSRGRKPSRITVSFPCRHGIT